MSEEYNLKYTNGFANRNKVEEKELIIEGDCKLTNYDPSIENGSKKGQITINLFDGEQSILEGLGNEQQTSEKANFSKKKYSIFTKIASLAGDKNTLSVEDLFKMDKTLIKEWGLKDLKIDYAEGVATLVWGENDILRIDFEKVGFFKRLKNKISEISLKHDKKNNASKNSDFKGEIIPQTEYKIKSGDRIITIANELGIPLACIEAANSDKDLNKLVVGETIIIPMRKTVNGMSIRTSSDIANATGFSEKFIDTLKFNEGFSSEPYWDKKRYSVGYGHSGRILGKYIDGENDVLDLIEMNSKNIGKIRLNQEEANAILAQDILTRIAEAEAKFGESFNKAPKSLQSAIVDIIFNAGSEKAFEDSNTKNIASNLQTGDYISAIKNLILYPKNPESYKRNCYRIISALQDFSNKDRTEILNDPKIKEYFETVKAYLNKNGHKGEVKRLDAACDELLST